MQTDEVLSTDMKFVEILTWRNALASQDNYDY